MVAVVAVVADVAVEAFPNNVAVMLLAVKFPLASRATMALAVLALVAVVALLETLPAVLMVANLVSAMAAALFTIALVITSLATVVLRLTLPVPSMFWAVAVTFPVNPMVRVVCHRLAVEALPLNVVVVSVAVEGLKVNLVLLTSTGKFPLDPVVNRIKWDPLLAVSSVTAILLALVAVPDSDAVMVPALKLPLASRATIVLALFRLVAVVALLETLPAVLMVASLVSAMAAALFTIALVITSLATVVLRLTLPVPSMFWAVAVTFPVNPMVRVVAHCVAVEAFPSSVAVMLLAVKFPLASRATMALAVLALVAVVALFGMLVSEAPLPLNTVEDKVPVEGLYSSLVLLTLLAWLPLVPEE